MKQLQYFALIVVVSATSIGLVSCATSPGETNHSAQNHFQSPSETVTSPAWIPDTLCNGKPSLKTWTLTDQYRLDSGNMLFEWEYDGKGDSCLISIVTRLPPGTIEHMLPK